MGKLADKLSEKSKFDDSVIVGSEIRAALQELCDEAQRWHERYLTETAEGGRMRHHLENTIQTMKEMGTQSGQTISTSWVLRMAESALPATVTDGQGSK